MPKGADPRAIPEFAGATAAQEMEILLERQRLAAERYDVKQQELEQLLLMVSDTADVLAETMTWARRRRSCISSPNS